MHPSLTNPFLRGFQDLRYERVLQISYADDCPPCYRALHPAQNELPNEAINLQPCLFDDDFTVITDGVCVPEFLRMRCPADGVVNIVLYQILGSQLGRSMHIGDLGNVEAAQNLIEQLSFATGHNSRSWEISSAHLPADDLEYLQVRACAIHRRASSSASNSTSAMPSAASSIRRLGSQTLKPAAAAAAPTRSVRGCSLTVSLRCYSGCSYWQARRTTAC